MNIILALALALGLAVSAPAPTAQPAPTAPVAATVAPVTVETTSTGSTVQCEEDMPCWDCSQMGNTICGPTPVLAKEAWEAFSTDGFTEEELATAFKATYHGTTVSPQSLPDGEWYFIQSTIQPTLYHVFELEFGATR